MLEMDCFKTTRSIRGNDGKRRHSIIVALTADAMTENREKCLQAGMDDYLNKPIKSEQVTAIFKKWLQNRNLSLSSV